jgi:hypothetical protein
MELVCGLSPERIEEFKAKYGVVFVVEIPEGEMVHKAVFREPDVTILTAVNAIGKTDEMKATMVLYENCLLAADPSITKRDLLKIEVAKAISERMTILTKTVKNL